MKFSQFSMQLSRAIKHDEYLIRTGTEEEKSDIVDYVNLIVTMDPKYTLSIDVSRSLKYRHHFETAM